MRKNDNRNKNLTETDIQNECRIAASEMGAVVFRNNIGAAENPNGQKVYYGVGRPGGSDLLGIYHGTFLAMEVKKPGKKPSKNQATFMKNIKLHGGIAGVVRCKEDVYNLLTHGSCLDNLEPITNEGATK